MTDLLSRRFLLAGLAATAGTAATANAPLHSIRPRPRGTVTPTPPTPDLIAKAGLGGEIAYQVVRADTGAVVEEWHPELRQPPASVTKAATAFYALSRLGPAHRFATELVATGPVQGGRLDGDLILRGGGDPTLDTDGLGSLAETLVDMGVTEVTGRFRTDASALPALPHIDPDQPDHVGYNPALCGLNLNFNRVHFEWKRAGSGYDVTLEARALKYRPDVTVAQLQIEDRKGPVFTYERSEGRDHWTVARAALGKDGARWLPVRDPEAYAGEVFRAIAASKGLRLDAGATGAGMTGTVIARHDSGPLADVMRDMLKYSTNLTAEAVGLAASRRTGAEPHSLIRSAREMNLWLNDDIGARSCGFVDHSGLGYGARVSPRDMVRVLRAARASGQVPDLLKPFKTPRKGIRVHAKTGTLNFVSALAGFIDRPDAPPLAFAIFTADKARRDAIPVAQRERPPGARAWANRSRTLQKKLIDRWADLART